LVLALALSFPFPLAGEWKQEIWSSWHNHRCATFRRTSEPPCLLWIILRGRNQLPSCLNLRILACTSSSTHMTDAMKVQIMLLCFHLTKSWRSLLSISHPSQLPPHCSAVHSWLSLKKVKKLLTLTAFFTYSFLCSSFQPHLLHWYGSDDQGNRPSLVPASSSA
jgi:hypothetical protein